MIRNSITRDFNEEFPLGSLMHFNHNGTEAVLVNLGLNADNMIKFYILLHRWSNNHNFTEHQGKISWDSLDYIAPHLKRI